MWNYRGEKQMLKMIEEDQAKLAEYIKGAAALLHKYTEPEKLETFEGIELELRVQIQEVVAPQIGEFFSRKGENESVIKGEQSRLLSAG
jgi:hypothetical protein